MADGRRDYLGRGLPTDVSVTSAVTLDTNGHSAAFKSRISGAVVASIVCRTPCLD